MNVPLPLKSEEVPKVGPLFFPVLVTFFLQKTLCQKTQFQAGQTYKLANSMLIHNPEVFVKSAPKQGHALFYFSHK